MALEKDQKYKALNAAIKITEESAKGGAQNSTTLAAIIEKTYVKITELMEQIEK